MNNMTLAAAAGVISICLGCSNVLSLHPFVTAAEAAVEPALTGIWEEGKNTYIVKAGPERTYTITLIVDDESKSKFEGRLVKAGDAMFLDVSPAEDGPFYIKGHGLVRLWLEGDSLRWAFVDQGAFREAAGEVVTAPQKEVRALMMKHAFDMRSYGGITTLTRVRH